MSALLNLKLSDGTQRALYRAGVHSVEELRRCSSSWLLGRHGIGRKRLQEIKDALERGVFSFCMHCSYDVVSTDGYCPDCRKLMWQALATEPHDFKHKVRTTSDTYAPPVVVDAINQLKRMRREK